MGDEEFEGRYTEIYIQRYGEVEKFYTPRHSGGAYMRRRKVVGSLDRLIDGNRLITLQIRKRSKWNHWRFATFYDEAWMKSITEASK